MTRETVQVVASSGTSRWTLLVWAAAAAGAAIYGGLRLHGFAPVYRGFYEKLGVDMPDNIRRILDASEVWWLFASPPAILCCCLALLPISSERHRRWMRVALNIVIVWVIVWAVYVVGTLSAPISFHEPGG